MRVTDKSTAVSIDFSTADPEVFKEAKRAVKEEMVRQMRWLHSRYPGAPDLLVRKEEILKPSTPSRHTFSEILEILCYIAELQVEPNLLKLLKYGAEGKGKEYFEFEES